MKVLVSGFEPFLDEKVNPTEAIVDFLNSCDSHSRPNWGTLDIRGVKLPVVFESAFRRLEQERLLFRPDIILSFGLAGGRTAIEIEQLAVNIRGGDQTARGDNSGRVENGIILENGPATLPTTLPTERLLQALSSAGVPSRKSYTAGTYVCNDLFYLMQDRLRFTRVQSGFIHVPRMTDEKGEWPWSKFELAVDAIFKDLARG